VVCWGANSYGELGDGTTAASPAPVIVAGLSAPALAVSAGAHYSCALLSGGAVRCWGNGEFGKLGDGDVTNHTTPVQTASLAAGAAAVDAGSFSTCALLSGGAVRCWGRNDQGQVGDGATGSSRLTPVAVVCN
jgi:alpha-tubulin suppressor-like RCC1 family protein